MQSSMSVSLRLVGFPESTRKDRNWYGPFFQGSSRWTLARPLALSKEGAEDIWVVP